MDLLRLALQINQVSGPCRVRPALATPGAWVQFGVQAANASISTGTGLCNATLRIEEKEK